MKMHILRHFVKLELFSQGLYFSMGVSKAQGMNSYHFLNFQKC